ncbi:hypothetical protein RE628_18485 [Paenibacillus sp. D2_2]|uniref:hypothetical protein n=1 Tax=Paenibacillus sp. D2_2 TaxID=3073092 RepID=UPI0028167655|nr:hypothetical protein [Paenibacillus sp. D2_2]WMT39416.1 hypothetical protein RE628_18485 [Paenibacillus sp. D2_2]
MAVPGILEEELALIKSALLLKFVRHVFQRDARILEQSGVLKSPEIYVEMIQGGEQRAALVLSEIQTEFRKRKIKLYQIRQDENGIWADYTCRGYRGEMRILWSGLRHEINSRMRAYLGGDALKRNRLQPNRRAASDS